MAGLQYYCRRCDRWVPVAHTHGKGARNPITRRKARLVLHHGEVQGRPLTEKQRRFFGARASGYPYRRNGIAGSLWKGAKAGYHHYQAGRYEEKAKRHRSKAVLNPASSGRRVIPGRALEIRYLRSDGKKYFHPFEHNVTMLANRDGSVTLRGTRRIHADDRESGFWQRYGHHRRRNPVARRRRRRQQDNTWLWLVGGAALFLLWSRPAAAVSTGGQLVVGQGAGTIWYSDPYQGGGGEFFTGSLPPGSSPPWRIASATEIGTMQMGLLTGALYEAGGGLVAPSPGFLT